MEGPEKERERVEISVAKKNGGHLYLWLGKK